MTNEQDHSLLELTADIVSAFVSKNQVRSSELSELIASVHASLQQIGEPKAEEAPAVASTPAVSIKKSVTDDYLICLDDGKKFKSLKRHLAQLGMTPNDYRAKWGLPSNYPMVAPGYAAKRSELAKATGLGNSRKAVAADVEPVAEPANDAAPTAGATEAPAKRRGRPKKAA